MFQSYEKLWKDKNCYPYRKFYLMGTFWLTKMWKAHATVKTVEYRNRVSLLIAIKLFTYEKKLLFFEFQISKQAH